MVFCMMICTRSGLLALVLSSCQLLSQSETAHDNVKASLEAGRSSDADCNTCQVSLKFGFQWPPQHDAEDCSAKDWLSPCETLYTKATKDRDT